MSGPTDRRRRWIVGGVYGAAILAMTLPWPRVWAGGPLILGIPPSIAWVIFWLVVTFCLVLWLYRTEPGSDRG